MSEPIQGPAALFVNAKSRQGQAQFNQALIDLKALGLDVRDSQLYRDIIAMDRRIAEVVKAGTPLVIVGGGDGTLSTVVRHFVGSETTMGVLPLGTGNAFARDLSLPFSLSEACRVISHGDTRRVDLGFAQDDYFVNVLTAGLTTRIVVELKSEAKKRFGRMAYLFAMGRALASLKAFHAKLITAEKTLEFETLQVVVGNGRYHAGPFPLSPDASITEGKLTVYALATTNRAAFLKLAWKLRTGRQCELPEVYSLSTALGRLETTPSGKVVVDGEIIGSTPVDFRVEPRALAVRVPRAADVV